MSDDKKDEIAEIATMSPNEMSAEQRQQLIAALSDYDTEKFIKDQGQNAIDNVKKIKSKQEEFDQKGEKYAAQKFSAYMKQHPNEKITIEILERFERVCDNQSDFYRKRYANSILGMGNGTYSYCIGLQRDACKKANSELGYDIMPDIGLSCNNARAYFDGKKQGQYHDKISDCFNEITNKVKYNSDGTPKLKDGDLLLMVDPKDNQAYHCVRVNVDENGNVSYTAGNGEAVSGKLNWCKNKACYVIPTSEVANQNAQQHYSRMSNEELLEAAKEKGLIKENKQEEKTAENANEPKQTDNFKTAEQSNELSHSSSTNSELEQFSSRIQNNHSNISERIATFRERRNTESLNRTDMLAMMRAGHARLQEKRAELGKNDNGINLSFINKHYACEDIAADIEAKNEQAKSPIQKLSGMQKIINFFRTDSQYG